MAACKHQKPHQAGFVSVVHLNGPHNDAVAARRSHRSLSCTLSSCVSCPTPHNGLMLLTSLMSSFPTLSHPFPPFPTLSQLLSCTCGPCRCTYHIQNSSHHIQSHGLNTECPCLELLHIGQHTVNIHSNNLRESGIQASSMAGTHDWLWHKYH